MDIATLLGLVIGMIVIIWAIMTGSDLWVFLNGPGFLIVVCGTFAATLIKFPITDVFSAFKTGVKAAFVNDKNSPRELVDLSVDLAKNVRQKGLLYLESANIPNPFFKHGLKLCVDSYDPETIRKSLTKEMEQSIASHETGEKIFRGIGDAAPAFGMIGTLVGLVQMLVDMSDPKTIGPAMAIALLTTLYGAVIANLVAIPIADKLEMKTEQEWLMKSLVIESVLQIQQQQNPNVLEEILMAYLPEGQREAPSEDKPSGKPKTAKAAGKSA